MIISCYYRWATIWCACPSAKKQTENVSIGCCHCHGGYWAGIAGLLRFSHTIDQRFKESIWRESFGQADENILTASSSDCGWSRISATWPACGESVFPVGVGALWEGKHDPDEQQKHWGMGWTNGWSCPGNSSSRSTAASLPCHQYSRKQLPLERQT